MPIKYTVPGIPQVYCPRNSPDRLALGQQVAAMADETMRGSRTSF